MTLGDLMDAFRSRAFDTAPPYLWSDDELREYADDAENEAADRARLIKDTITPAICQVAVVAGTADYMLDSRVLSVERAKLDLGTSPLNLTSTDAMDASRGLTPRDWRTQTPQSLGSVSGAWDKQTGTPLNALLDAEGPSWKLRLHPIPTVNDTLRLQVFRLPISLLSTDEGNIPEIPYRLHIRLVDWMVYRAYSKQDAETFDRTKAAEAEAVFTRAFGERIDANARRKQEDRAPCVTVFQEF